MEKDYSKLLEEIATLKALVQALEERIKAIEEGSIGTGVYLDGCPEYAQEYIISNVNKKDGE